MSLVLYAQAIGVPDTKSIIFECVEISGIQDLDPHCAIQRKIQGKERIKTLNLTFILSETLQQC